jgi:hypothetical protein
MKTVEFNGKKIKVKEYIPIFAKMVIADKVTEESLIMDSYGNINKTYLNIYKVFSLLVYYIEKYNFPTLSVDLENGEKENRFDLEKIYTLGIHEGLVNLIKDTIGEDEYFEFDDCIMNAVNLKSKQIKDANSNIQYAFINLLNTLSKKVEQIDPEKFLKDAGKLINKKNIDKAIKAAEELGFKS